MLQTGIVLTVSTICFLLLPATLHAQSRPGSVADSWKAAAAQPAQTATAKTTSDAAAWQKSRSSKSRPWPSLPDNPVRSDYYKANTLVIDSLARLYCVSSSYLHTLRQRNEKAGGDAPSITGNGGKAFQYAPAPAAAPQGRESLQTLYRELTSLLDRCIHGR